MSTVGDTLRSAREAKGLSVQQVADLTKIKTEHVRDLESGNYKAFAAPVYIRGFVRTYAGILKLDAPRLVKMAEEEISEIEAFRHAPSLGGKRQGPLDFLTLQLSKINWRIALPVGGGVLVCVVLVMAVRAWKTQPTNDPAADLKPALFDARSSGETLPVPPPGSVPATPVAPPAGTPRR